jgi:stage V sporulation protein S
MTMIKVSATSRTSAVAGAIAGVVREHHRAEVQAIGAGAVNQAVKALIVATGYLRLDGIHVRCVPEFADITIEDKVRTAIKLVIEPGPTPNSRESANVTTEDKGSTAIEQVVEPQRFPDVSEAS